MAERWSSNPQYSHGFLVPVFAGVVLWHRRHLAPASAAPCWWGLPVVLSGVVLRLVGTYGGIEALEGLALLPTLAGLCLMLAGWRGLQWTWPAIAFLWFMLPLPFVAETALAHPLQRLATTASTYLLQTLGMPALAEGNIILIEDIKLGVTGACGGLGMLMTFFALSTAVAIVVQRRWTDKLLIIASAVPIAVFANVVRITATGVVHCYFGQQAGNMLHDWAGWLMMPLALGILALELWFLDRLLVETEPTSPLPIGLTGFFGDAKP
jgi:exosortase